MTKRVSDLEIHLKTVKSECVEAMSNKENALREQFKTFDQKNNRIQAEHEQLKKQLIREQIEHEEYVKELQEEHSAQIKEKERLIKQAKSERDSLYEELK